MKKTKETESTEFKKDDAQIRESDDIEIDLLDLAAYLMDRIHYLIFFFLLGAVILNAYTFFKVKPTYTSTAKLYMVTASNDSVVNLSDLNIGTSLTADYQELLNSYPILEQVIEKLDLKMTAGGLSSRISLKNPSNTRILEITVTTTDAQLSADIANTLAEASVEYLPETMSTMAPNIAQRARPATMKSGPSYRKYTMIGALAGLLCCIGYFVIMYLIDDTIHSADDMEKYFGIVPLTTISEIDSLHNPDEAQRNKKHRRHHRRSKVRKGYGRK